MSAVARNAPCPCGSGAKFKHCCGGPNAPASAAPSGIALLRAGQPEAALPLLLAAAQANPADFTAHHALGTALLQTGRFAQASAMLHHATTLDPKSAAAFWDLAASYDHQGRHEEAIAAYQQAASRAPRQVEIHRRLGQLYAQYNRATEAAAALHRAADAAPPGPQAWLYRSDAELLRQNIAQAEHYARRAAALAAHRDPALHAKATGALAGLLLNQGRFAEAEEAYEQALRHAPGAAQFLNGLAQCRKYPSGTDLIARIEQHLAGTADDARLILHFALGKLHDDGGDYAGAMRHFEAGNALRARTINFDRAALAALVDRAIAGYTKSSLARAAAVGLRETTPLFITGIYRSGTTLVEQILSAHPAIHAGGELGIFREADLEPDPATGLPDPARGRAAATEYCASLRQLAPHALRVTDKLPANLFRLGALHALLPDAKLIHIERDPIDICLSIYTTLFATPLPFAARKSDLVFYIRQVQRIIRHWRTVLPADIVCETRYETLIADRAAETRRLVAHTGLNWHEACLAPEQNSRAIATASAWQARQPVYASSVQRWQKYEAFLGEWRELHEPA